MKKLSYIRYLASLLVIFVLAGCTDDIELPNPTPDIPQELEEYYFVLDNPVMSRSVEYTDDNHSEFSGGELLGCFALDENDSQVANTKPNVCYVVSVISSENETINGKKVLVPNNPADKLDKGYKKYLFYYPYNKDIKSLDELKKLTHSVKSDQRKHEDYEASDLLWDVAVPTDRVCRVEMDHAMANIIIVIDGVEYDVEKGAVVLGQPLTATDVNLTAPDSTAMRKKNGKYYYTVDNTQDKKDIPAMYADYPTENDRFRVAVPACRTLRIGDPIVKLWSAETREPKIFKLKSDVLLEAGKNYIFTLIKKGKPHPTDKDDDSWVLDVLDPETGEPVGLLCREYVRYQQGNNTGDQRATGQNGINSSDSRPTKWIDSQAWVFYNLIEGDLNGTPDLTTGCILRFVYDVRINAKEVWYDGGAGNSGQAGTYWPAPHNYRNASIILVDHEHGWVDGQQSDILDEPFLNGQKKEVPYYMHGGRIYWNGEKNKIVYFDMPTEKITTDVAKNQGHIAIPKKGKPYVSYKPLISETMDNENCKVGFILPHYLIDTRFNEDTKSTELRRYPIVKIGFNMFWMSESLRAKTLTDGTPLKNYCLPVDNGKFKWDAIGADKPTYKAGFCYPGKDDGTKLFNPSNLSSEELEKLKMTVLYNFTAAESGKMIPNSVEGKSSYHMPKRSDIRRMLDYLGFAGLQKILTNKHQARDNNGPIDPDKDDVQCLLEGKILYGNYGTYTPNVSGLNLRADGFFIWTYSKSGFYNTGQQIALMLESENINIGRQIFSISTWNTWTSQEDQILNDGLKNDESGYVLKKNSHEPSELFASRTFLPIRFFLQYELPRSYYSRYDETFSPYVSRAFSRSLHSAPCNNATQNIHVGLESY